MKIEFSHCYFTLFVLLAPLAVIAWYAKAMLPWQAAIVIFLVGSATWVTLAYLSAIRKAHAVAILARPIWWGRFLSGHGFRMLLSFVPALLSGVGVLVAVLDQGMIAITWFGLTGVLVIELARNFSVHFSAYLRPFAHGRGVILISAVISAIVMTTVVTLTSGFGNSYIPTGLDGLFETSSGYTGSSEAIALLSDWAAFLSGAKAMVEHEAGRGLPTWLIMCWRLVAAFSYFFALALACSATLIASPEARRILSPTDSDEPAEVGLLSAGVASALTVIVAFMIFQSLARIEAITIVVAQRQSIEMMQPELNAGRRPADNIPTSDAPPTPQRASPLSPVGIRQTVEAEIIGNLQCRPGTIAEIEGLDRYFLAMLDQQEDHLRSGIRTGFDGVRSNVPGFLDWYYSLSAEYLRTFNLATGSGVEYLDGQLQSILAYGNPLSGVETAIEALAGNTLLAELYQESRSKKLAECAIDIPRDEVEIVRTESRPAEFLETEVHLEAIDLQTRLLSASLGGVTSGIAAAAIMAKISAKAIGKPIFAVAAKTLAKIAGGKALSFGGGVLIGGGTGAAGGSIIPGAGTVVGAIAGGVAGGIAVMLGVDFALLKLDEAVSRKEFEAEIIHAIDEAESDLLAELGL